MGDMKSTGEVGGKHERTFEYDDEDRIELVIVLGELLSECSYTGGDCGRSENDFGDVGRPKGGCSDWTKCGGGLHCWVVCLILLDGENGMGI